MNRITAARTRLEQARDLAGLLAAAYDAFDDMLAVIRCHEEHAGGAFAAFVLSATAAANGRDWVAAAPSMPPGPAPARPAAPAGTQPAEPDTARTALAIAALSQLLAGLLPAAAADAGDRACLAHAARHAARIHSLLAGSQQR